MKTYKFRGEWKGKSSGGCLNHYTWRYNPQLFLTVKETTEVNIKLLQEHEQPSTLFHIGFYVAKSDGTGRRQLYLPRDQLVGKANFEASTAVGITLQLDAATLPYIIIPCTFNPQEECKFTMTFSCAGPINLEPLSPNKEWKHVMLEGEWTKKSAGGCKNYPTCVNNPQYLLTVTQPINLHVLLVQANQGDFDYTGFYILRTTTPALKLTKISPADLAAKPEFAMSRDGVYLNTSLTPDTSYIIIPCTYDPGWEGQFRLIVLSDHPVKLKKLQETRGHTVDGSWTPSTAGGCINHPTWRMNPQYLLTLSAPVMVTIMLKQHDENNLASIGFYLMRSCDVNKQLILRQKNLVAKGSFEKRKSISISVQLEVEEQPYVIIPCTFLPNQLNTFTLSVAPHTESATEDLQLKLCSQSYWKHCRVSGGWSGPTAGGCRNNKTWINNPQFSVYLKEESALVIILTQSASENSMGFYIIKTTECAPILNAKDFVHKPCFRKDEEVHSEIKLQTGYYNIIPCLFSAGVEGTFALAIYCNNNFDFVSFDNSCKTEMPNQLSNTEDLLPRASIEKEATKLEDMPAASSQQHITDVPNTTTVTATATATATATTSAVLSGAGSVAGEGAIVSIGATPQLQQQLQPPQMQVGTPPLLATTETSETERHPWEIDFDEVQILEQIGKGGFGVVYKGTWRGTTVAVKKLLHNDMDDSEYEEFVREVEIMSKLRHPQIVLFLGACLQRPHICILTEFLEKGNLAEVLKDTKLDWKTKLMMARHAAQGMTYLHQSKPRVVHRDLKSLNLLVDENYHVKVADFGLSKISVTGNTYNSKVGSLNWCAPEILLNSMPYTDKADVYSFGMVLWELITHAAPFQGMHPLQIVRAIDQGKLPEIPPNCPCPSYARLIEACWDKDPDARPSFEVILQRIKEIEKELNLT